MLTRIMRFAPLFLMIPAVFGQGRNYGRSMVITKQGIAATSQTLASQAAAQILAKGGSAVDAAIAANAVLGLVEPMMNGMGGDLFVIYWDAKSGKLTGLNASGPAPRGLSPNFWPRRACKTMPATASTASRCRERWTDGRRCIRSSGSCRGRICSRRRSRTPKKDFR